jgi:hypothetical protein
MVSGFRYIFVPCITTCPPMNCFAYHIPALICNTEIAGFSNDELKLTKYKHGK